MKLTKRQILFCLEYLKDFNATQAAIRAGYSKRSANVIAAQNLTKLSIQKNLNELIEKKFKKMNMDSDKAFELMIKHATYDLKDFFDISNIKMKDSNDKDYNETIISLKDYEKLDGTLISEIKQTKDGIQIKLPDRQKALDQIGKVLEMFTEKMKSEHIETQEYRLIIERPESEDNGNGKYTKTKIKSLAR